ncbi:MAG: protein kinase [Candidatus Obscuribacterales bacterium]|nr:protein kinase [Candidatus Obscuribacterales bacterium]
MAQIIGKNQRGDLIDGRYRIVEKIGEGGMGQIYLCDDTKLERQVAVKLLNQDAPNLSIQRFHVEAKALAKANHQNILRILDFGQAEDTRLYLVVEYIKGMSLAKLIDQDGAMPLSAALDIMIQLSEGLAYAHQHRILHRDVKPSNVMLVANKSGAFDAKFVDFGLAKLTAKDQYITKTGTAMGTPAYMSPETVCGADLDERSDIYSLGCLMFELLAGTPPFLGPTALDTMAMHCERPSPTLFEMSDISFPDEVERIVRKCLMKNPDERYQSAKILGEDLAGVGARSSVSIEVAALAASQGENTPPARPSIWRRLEPYLVLVATACLLVSVAIATLDREREQGKAVAPREPGARRPDAGADDTDGIKELAEAQLAPRVSKQHDDTLRQWFCDVSGDLSYRALASTIEKYRDLKNFHFYRTPFYKNGLNLLLPLDLEELRIEQTPLNDADLKAIGHLSTLKRLRLINAQPLSKTAVANLTKLKNLEVLEIRCAGKADGHFEIIADLPKLETLVLWQYDIEQSNIAQLQKSPNLSSVMFQSCTLATGALSELKKLSNLKYLSIIDTPVSAPDINGIVKLPLKKLRLCAPNVSDFSIGELATMRTLEELDLSGMEMSEKRKANLKGTMKATKVIVGEL